MVQLTSFLIWLRSALSLIIRDKFSHLLSILLGYITSANSRNDAGLPTTPALSHPSTLLLGQCCLHWKAAAWAVSPAVANFNKSDIVMTPIVMSQDIFPNGNYGGLWMMDPLELSVRVLSGESIHDEEFDGYQAVGNSVLRRIDWQLKRGRLGEEMERISEINFSRQHVRPCPMNDALTYVVIFLRVDGNFSQGTPSFHLRKEKWSFETRIAGQGYSPRCRRKMPKNTLGSGLD